MADSRLFKILYYLLDRERATAPELAAEFEVSTRTIYRDVRRTGKKRRYILITGFYFG